VYGWEHAKKGTDEDGGEIAGFAYPIKVGKSTIPNRHVNLLVVEKYDKAHYCLIRDFSRLIAGINFLLLLLLILYNYQIVIHICFLFYLYCIN
jgi:hypothetical protein